MEDNDDVLSKRANQERMLISRLSKEDLEDKYLKVYDENIILKKHARKQEDRIKKMATKLVRLVEDKKKSMNDRNSNLSLNSGKRMRDVDSEELIADLQSKVSELEVQNKRLKENLQISKVQLQTIQTQKTPVSNIYSNVSARIDTGLPKRDHSFTRNLRTISSNQNMGSLSARSMVTSSNNRQLQEMEFENMDLKSRLDEYESQIYELQDQLHAQKQSYEDSMALLKNQVSQNQITGVQENIDQIRLQRELKDKVNQYTELYSKFNNLTQQHGQLKSNHDRLLDEIERFNQQLKQEQQRNIALKTELKNASQNSREILELQQRIEDLNRDNQVLKETNEKLLNSAFSLEREREFRERERTLKIQIAQLEATLKTDVGEKGTILDRLNNEREQYDKLNTDMREMQVKYYEMKQKYDEMNEKMQFLSKESNIDFSEIEEALILVKERRANKHTDEFYNLIDSEKIKAYQRKLVNLEAQLAETIGELDKSRHLLITQVKINDDYKKEVNLIQSKMEENKADYDAKMLEYAQLLDIRALRIKKLEKQLKDIAYGTKQVRLAPDIIDEESEMLNKAKRRESYSFVGAPTPNMLDHYLTANLERGQNIFEIHIIRVVYTEEAVQIMKEMDPSTFCTIEFYEHDLQTTPIVKGQRPEFNFTSQYVIRVDDFFLHYLQKETATIELHQAIGSDYETRAACQISFRDLIDKQTSRIHGSSRLLCVNSSNVGVSFGAVDYWARLIVPVDEAFRLYKQKTKALGYLATNVKAAADDQDRKQTQAAAGLAERKLKPVDNMNELNINVLRCTKINSLAGGAAQPSVYCVYKFYDFADHDTEIIASSNYPEFNDHRSFAVTMDIDLDKYLKNFALEIYVFDDNEPEETGLYLGVARIPLIALAHDKDIKGTFELKKADGTPNGTIDVTFYWKYSYLPPAASTFSASGSKQPTAERKSSTGLLPGEKLEEPMSLVQKAKKMGIKFPVKQSSSPTQNQRSSPRSPQSGGQFSNPASPRLRNPELVSKKRVSIVSNPEEHSIGNTTIRDEQNNNNSKTPTPVDRPVTPPPASAGSRTVSPAQNPHYNDTMFGDEMASRTQSPNELDGLTNAYLDNMTKSASEASDDGRRARKVDQIEPDQSSIEEEPFGDGDTEPTGVTPANNDHNEAGTEEFAQTGKTDDDVVVSQSRWDPNDTAKLPKAGNEDNVIIEISSFTLKENTHVLRREDIKRIYVSMEFLDYDPSGLESITALPKPPANQPANYNFRKIFSVDAENNMDKRHKLAEMIVDKNRALIRFAIVSEPEQEDDECVDIGYAYVDINDILDQNQDFIDKEIKLLDANNERVQIGKMKVTVEILAALLAVKREIALEQTM